MIHLCECAALSKKAKRQGGWDWPTKLPSSVSIREFLSNGGTLIQLPFIPTSVPCSQLHVRGCYSSESISIIIHQERLLTFRNTYNWQHFINLALWALGGSTSKLMVLGWVISRPGRGWFHATQDKSDRGTLSIILSINFKERRNSRRNQR